MEFTPRQLTWFRHNMFVKKLLDAFPRLKPESYLIYSSMMQKLGVKIEIKQQPITQPTGSI